MTKSRIALLLIAPFLLASCTSNVVFDETNVKEIIGDFSVNKAQEKYASGISKRVKGLNDGYLDNDESVKVAELCTLANFNTEKETVETNIESADFASYLVKDEYVDEVYALILNHEVDVNYNYDGDNDIYSVYATISESNHELGEYKLGYAEYLEYSFNGSGLLTKVDHTCAFAKQLDSEKEATIKFVYSDITTFTWVAK